MGFHRAMGNYPLGKGATAPRASPREGSERDGEEVLGSEKPPQPLDATTLLAESGCSCSRDCSDSLDLLSHQYFCPKSLMLINSLLRQLFLRPRRHRSKGSGACWNVRLAGGKRGFG